MISKLAILLIATNVEQTEASRALARVKRMGGGAALWPADGQCNTVGDECEDSQVCAEKLTAYTNDDDSVGSMSELWCKKQMYCDTYENRGYQNEVYYNCDPATNYLYADLPIGENSPGINEADN